jgi:Protein of unknown function (DUF2851)
MAWRRIGPSSPPSPAGSGREGKNRVSIKDLPDLFPHACLYRQLRGTIPGVGDPEEPYRPAPARDQPTEHLLHVLWLQQELLRQPLVTLDNRVVTVYRPGRWSRGSGPDFLDAKLQFDDGPMRVGAVEVHVCASDWARHGHDRDPAYAKVLLHVVWRNDLDTPTIISASGSRIPQLELSTCVGIPLAELQEMLDDEGFPEGRTATLTPCQRSLQALAPETIGQLLDMAGEERWRQKASRFALKVERRGVEQALYELLLEALGFKGNRMPFWQLARLAPVARLREALGTPQPSPLQIQAILYGVSGFLRRWQTDLKRGSAEGRAYVETLQSHWEPLAQLFPEHLGERSWRLASLRPANIPQRRIAAAGYLLSGLMHQSLMDLLLAPLRELPTNAPSAVVRRCQRELAYRLRVSGEADYWRRRYAIDGLSHGQSVDLLGLGRAATMVIDVVLPAAAALSQLGHEQISLATVRALYLSHPRLPANEVTREMMRQFFGSDRVRAAVVNSACRQQALQQLYNDFCLNELETCQECAFPRLAARLEGLQTHALREVP